MQKTNLKNPNEQKKLIAAAVLGVIALIFLWWTFFGFGGSSSHPSRPNVAANQPPAPGSKPDNAQARDQASPEVKGDLLARLEVIHYQQSAVITLEPKRNIFAYYEPPQPAPKVSSTPSPTPTPVPPVLMTSLNPTNVFARTGDFTLEVTGDKFSSEVKVYVDNRELPTRVVSTQQLSAVVPASMIAAPGQKQVMVRSADGRLYSNTGFSFSVTPPPTPSYSYIGILGDKHYSRDVALVQDKNNKELLNVQRGDVLSGRFRVTSISEKELVLTDTTLKIKHTLAMSTENERGLGPLARPTPKVDSEDDEP